MDHNKNLGPQLGPQADLNQDHKDQSKRSNRQRVIDLANQRVPGLPRDEWERITVELSSAIAEYMADGIDYRQEIEDDRS